MVVTKVKGTCQKSGHWNMTVISAFAPSNSASGDSFSLVDPTICISHNGSQSDFHGQSAG